MIKVVVKPNQTLVDLAIQYGGEATELYKIAKANNMNCTDELIPGQTVIIPEVVNEKVTGYFKRNNLFPAVIETKPLQGFGYSILGQTFIMI